jgi:hypothetical protein
LREVLTGDVADRLTHLCQAVQDASHRIVIGQSHRDSDPTP